MKDYEVLNLKMDGWPLPDSYLIELGRVAALWTSMEGIINLCISKLSGFDINDPLAFILVTHSSFPQRLDMLSTLCEQHLPDHPNLEGYKAAVQKVKQAQKSRNDFMHYGMAAHPESGVIEMAKGTARGTLKVGNHPVTVADIRRATIQIHEAQLALYNLVMERDLKPMWDRL